MYVSDALREILHSRKKTQARLAEELGVSQPAIASVLSVGNPQTRILAAILDNLGYELIAVPKGTRLPNTAITLEVKRSSK